jgi:negative regulator of sigma E activity
VTGAEFHGVDIDLLADYVGGALDGTPEAERVAALIAAEPAWQEAYEVLAPEMATVGALLGDLPVEPMPADVVVALDAALARAALPVPADVVPGPADAVPQTVLDLAGQRRKRGNSRWARIAAPIGIAAGVAGLVGYGVLSQPQDSADTASSRPAAEDAGGMVVATPTETTASGIDYTLGTLSQPMNRTTGENLGGPSQRAQSEASIAGEDARLARLRAPDALLDCLDAIAQANSGGPLTVLSVDYARFTGKPALVVRFTAANGEWAWASGVDCGLPGGDADTLGSVPVR